MAKKITEFVFKTNADATNVPSFETSTCFNAAYVEQNISPIDNCINKIEQLNLIHTQYAGISAAIDNVPTIYNLILLGYISAIESYIREMLRKIIVIDKISRISCEIEEISYGSAMSYPKHLLPEVILEKASFASQGNILAAFKKFLGLNGHQPDELLKTLTEFEKICHLRHCIVHRFGKLGSQNAIKFGLDIHSKLIEKPLSLDVGMVYNLSLICTNTVLVVNKHLFTKILERTALKENNIWKWDFRKDKKLFTKYFTIFNSTKKPHSTSNINNAYSELRKFHNSL